MKKFKGADEDGGIWSNMDVMAHLARFLGVRDSVRFGSASKELRRVSPQLLDAVKHRVYSSLLQLDSALSLSTLYSFTVAARKTLETLRVDFGGYPEDLLKLAEFSQYCGSVYPNQNFLSSFNDLGLGGDFWIWADCAEDYFPDVGVDRAMREFGPFAVHEGIFLGLWNPDNMHARRFDRMPVAVMDSEGWGQVVASSLPECLSMLANQLGNSVGDFTISGSQDFASAMGYAAECLGDSPESGARLLFNRWVKIEFGLDPCADPGSLSKRAVEAAPNFQSWIDGCADRD